nr:NAD(P)/FAD-dependent oxidoreductase [Polymorphobacter sp.]
MTDDDIVAALEGAHIPSLLVAIAHLTGNADHLRDFDRPVYEFFGDGQGNLPPEQQAHARSLAAQAMRAHRDRGATLPQRPSPAAIRACMDFIAGADIPEPYVPFLTEELALDGPEARELRVTIDAPAAAKADFPVVVIGAGMSGLLMGLSLARAGLPFTIIEANADVGGTWLANQYPGVRVDTPNHLYSYSFEAEHAWSKLYSTGDVLYGYFAQVADSHGLRDHIRFNTRVEAATWDDATAIWRVRLDNGETLTARAVVSAVGQLNVPKYPDLPGVGDFAGPAFHSARWDHGVDLTGKRVAVIGTGASAFQFVPEIVAGVAHLSVFQRTPPWLGPTPDYHDAVPAATQWLIDHVPFYANWWRFWLFWMLTDGILGAVTRDAGWAGEGAISAVNDELRQALTGYIASQVEDRPDLLPKLIPAYPPGAKRMLRDNGVWIGALKRPNVDLIDDAIARIVPQGVELASGRVVAADVLIYGTGFHASDFLMPMTVTGEGGRDLHATWDGDARAYLGMTMPGFPNFFTIYGPNTNIVVNGSIIFFSECSVTYILGALKLLIEADAGAMTPKQEVHDAFNTRVDAANAEMAWGSPGVSSWYKSKSGRVSQNWPFALVDYWNATRAPDPADFELR